MGNDSIERLQAAFAHRKRRATPFLQAEVAQRMAGKLDFITLQPQVVAVVGSGHGESLPALAARYPDAAVVDVAASPLLQAERQRRDAPPWWRRWRGTRPIEPHIGLPDALPLADRSVDLLWANIAPAWCGTPETLAREWMRVLRPGGFVMFTTLGPDTARELRAAGAVIDTARLVDMHDWGDALVHAGFSDPVMDMEQVTLTYASAAQALGEWSALLPTRPAHRGLGAQAAQQSLVGRLQIHDAQRVAMTAEIVYGHAFCVERTPRTPATVALDAVRSALPSRRAR